HQRRRLVPRLGLRRLRRGRRGDGGARRHHLRRTEASGIRRSRRNRLAGRAVVRRHHSRVRRKAWRSPEPQGGRIMTPQTLLTLNAERAARRPAIGVTDIASGDQRLVKAADIARDPLHEMLEAQLRSGKSGTVEVGGKKLFRNVHAPAARLVMIGAVHISQALAPLARMLDYDVTIVDPRTAFASPERFPDVTVIAEWPDVALPPLNIDPYTAFVALTHDPKIDDPALTHALSRGCFYIGALGSRKTH